MAAVAGTGRAPPRFAVAGAAAATAAEAGRAPPAATVADADRTRAARHCRRTGADADRAPPLRAQRLRPRAVTAAATDADSGRAPPIPRRHGGGDCDRELSQPPKPSPTPAARRPGAVTDTAPETAPGADAGRAPPIPRP